MYGEILKNLRIENGLTQQQLAEILGFKSASAIGMVERQERELSVETIIKIAEYFNVSSDYLMGIIPFKNETEAYHSISIASMKYLRDNPLKLPYVLQNYVDYTAVFGNRTDNEVKAYCNHLLSNYQNRLPQTDLELFEISNILFLSIKWSPEYNGEVYFQPFNEKYFPFSIKLDFKKLDKITLDLSKSFLVNYKSGNSTFVKHSSVFNPASKESKNSEGTANIFGVKENNILDNPDNINKRIKDIEILEDFGEPEHALKFILSQPILAAYGGYDLNSMSDEEIIEIANDMLFAMRLSLEKLKKKHK